MYVIVAVGMHQCSRRASVYCGVRTVVLPGIYVSLIISPSGGVTRKPPDGIEGCKRRVS